MKTRLAPRERTAWVAVVAVLATSLLWLGTVTGVMALRLHAADLKRGIEVVLAVGRAIVRATLALAGHGWPVLAAMLAAAAVAGMLLRLPPSSVAEGRLRHG